jgi:hypothetical protein
MWWQLKGTLKVRSFYIAELCRYSTGLFLHYLWFVVPSVTRLRIVDLNLVVCLVRSRYFKWTVDGCIFEWVSVLVSVHLHSLPFCNTLT